MNGSQIYIEGQEDDKEYLFDEILPSDENTKGSYTRTFTSDNDFSEGTLKNVSQQMDDALTLEQIDSDQIKQEKDTREYDARKENTGFAITDAYGHTTTFDYDEAARLTKRTDAKGNTISCGYDENGNLTTTTDGEGNRCVWK